MVQTKPPIPSWDEIVELAAAAGIAHIGVAGAGVLERALAELNRRRDLGLHADMGFTYRNPERSTDPQRAVSGARSMIVAAMPYNAEPPTLDGPADRFGTTRRGRVARYAWIDYYGPLRAALGTIAQRLKASGDRAVVFADDNSLVDREAAYRAGIGWFGKNANLLVPGAGSFFVLGSIITTAEYPPHTQVADGCGSCQRCIDGCPTAAIVAPGVVDANRCLAWLVQRAGPFPVEFRAALGDRFYGCDDCQEVCPPTVRLASRHARALPDVDPFGDRQPPQPWIDLLELLRSDDETLLGTHGRWYVAGRDPRWWRRNALIILGNTAAPDDSEAIGILSDFAAGTDELLAEHASWALARIDERERAGVAASASNAGRQP